VQRAAPRLTAMTMFDAFEFDAFEEDK